MKKRVAVFPAGTEIGLEVHRALSYSTHFELYGFSSTSDHAKYVYKNYDETLPYFNSESFITTLNNLLDKYSITYIYPAHDDVQLFLTENETKIHAKVITSTLNSVTICRSKLQTYQYFKKTEFVPKVYDEDNIPEIYPVFAKPDIGQGSKGVRLIKNKTEFKEVIGNKEKMAIVEYLPGEEYTVDCFTNYQGRLLTANMRNRKRIRNGISVNSQSLPLSKKVKDIAEKINASLQLNGAWFFQLKRDRNNEFKLLEIAPRISGTMGLSRNKGINFPLLSLFNFEKLDVSIINNEYDLEVDRALVSRYYLKFNYDTVYVDLDDTLIVDQKINTTLLMFLYQALNSDRSIILISKHDKNIDNTLLEYKINKNIFKDIVQLRQDEDKSGYMKSDHAIFIDDSFAERINVSNKRGIPVFDSSEVEGLIDWRR
ncbi:ATP-grasp domain-containing protein [Gracilibacillus orientalis]|uniref:ATP-grasp domain-containing protein n=1 Tax=Gracilibacillus orientalis TaxID=334253 RepID=A0A1I4PDP2_9BACI|nr:ATP-grasp domain-containing protein [Gracilibacillus orientalis]SFM25735.1 ATP-grasp domain-containing protein [Gracilibacillus orientalis]